MAKNLFSVPIFFIVFRETLEASIIIAVLLSLAKQIVQEDSHSSVPSTVDSDIKEETDGQIVDGNVRRQRLIRKMRIQILIGAACGLLLALAIGAAFIAVWFTKASDLWAKSEELWEGIFELVASLIIFVMGITMLKMDRGKAKWRIKLQRAFEGKRTDGEGRTGKWALFILPFITVLREGLEAVVFVGGVSLGQPATSIPIAAIIGIICGFVVGYLIYAFASRTTLTIFMVIMTNFLLLIGAGLFSRSVGAFEKHAFNKLVGGDVGEAGNGPGSYRVQGNVWHLDCCSPESKTGNQGWTIFGAIFGWTNNATLGSVLAYVFYWIAVIAVLIFLKHKEGRTSLLGRKSVAVQRHQHTHERTTTSHDEKGDDHSSREENHRGVDVLPR
ncbi:Ftr1 protein [Crepidotus variabilis]|uniref:Ftr1 protein n=1 Tax=Crepidotus variabilis TaxID=179855 RepID=A0A9P6EJ34_9AGAR|nr:Ftr1 protein [Crepidotus variabilis]